MASTIKIKNSSTAGAVPTSGDLVQGELAINVTDRRIFTENASGTVVELGTPSIDDNGNATAITIDSSENVGIGTSSPSTTLHVSSASNPALILNRSVSTGDAGIRFESTGTEVAQIIGAYGGSLRFSTGSSYSERMRIDSSGNLLVGTTNSNPIGSNVAGLVSSPSGNFSVSRDAAPALDLNRYTSDGTVARFYRSASQVGRIDVTTTATSYVTSSDYRLKENPQPMMGALAVVAQLKPCTYTWKVNGQQGQGFIAHELAEVCPDAVVGDKDEVETVEIKDEEGNVIGTEDRPIYQGIDTSFLVATLTKAIQEQQALITTLTERITALEAK